LHPLEPIHEPIRDRGLADDADDSAHEELPLLNGVWDANMRHWPADANATSGRCFYAALTTPG
ncbi:MAG: hypothetical protein K2X43_21730, partial [Hyphomonadaceae bacterium]|nr:hypothetical protein [Hyphomonadaceae bacterium]